MIDRAGIIVENPSDSTYEYVPPGAVVRVTGVTEDGLALTVLPVAYDGEANVLVVGAQGLPLGGRGLAHARNEAGALLEQRDGAATAGESWGPATGCMGLRKDIPGYVVTAVGARGNIAAVRRDTNLLRISSTDRTAGWLSTKLLAGSNITLTVGSAGGSETLTVALSGSYVPTITVKEADGTPSVAANTLQIPSAASGSPLNLTDLGGGIAQLDISEASDTQEGTVTTGTQTFAGDKTFNDDVTILGNLHVDVNSQLDGTLDVEGVADFAEQVTVAAGSNKGILIGANGNQVWSAGAVGSSTVVVSAVDGFSRYGRMDLHSNGGIYLWNSLLSGYEPQRILPGQTTLTFTVYTGTGTSYDDVVIDASAKELQLPATWDVTVGGVSIIGLTVADIGVTVQGYDATLNALAGYNTNGILCQTAADTFAGRTLTGTASRVSVSNGSGVSGNPTVDIDSSYVGQTSITTLGTIATGTWQGTRIGSAYAGVPSGAVMPYAGSSVPTGWLECDGTAVSRTTYADLFTAISTTWGTGDGSTTFNLPDLRGRTPIGAGTGSGLTARTLGGTGGAEEHTLNAAQMPNHTHDTITKSSATGFGSAGAVTRANAVSDGTVATSSTGSGSPHNNMQPWAALKMIIKT